jgi:BA14K-like protein
MTGLKILSVAALAAVAIPSMVTPSFAIEKRVVVGGPGGGAVVGGGGGGPRFGGGGGGWHGGGPRYGGGGWHGGGPRYGGWRGGGFGPGFAAGAIIGSGIAANSYYGGYGYGGGPYYGSSYGYYDDDAPDVVEVAPTTGGGDVDYCIRTYKSYNVRTGTYLGYDGQRHACP